MRSHVSLNRIRLCARPAGVATIMVVWLMGCASIRPPNPETGYRANVTATVTVAAGEEPELSRFVEFYHKGKRRRQTRIDGNLVALIDRPDLRISWLLNPQARTFEEYRISSLEAVIASAPNPFGPRANATFELLGTENVDGINTQKYAVKGKAISGYAWFTIDRIPVRFNGVLSQEGSAVELDIAYTEVRRGPQAAYLFAIPPNYADYDNRKQKPPPYSAATDDASRTLDEQRRGRQYPYGAITPPLPPPSY